MSAESRKKMRFAQLARSHDPAPLLKWVAEHGSAWKGKSPSEETREKMREAKLKQPTNYWLGKHRYEETNLKVSRTLKANGFRPPLHPEHIKNLLKWVADHPHHLKGKHRPPEVVKRATDAQRAVLALRLKEKGWSKWPPESREGLRQRRLNYVIPVRNTKIEVLAQESMIRRGIPFIANLGIEGRTQPDLVLADYKIAVYCDGCYWHGCPVHAPKLIRSGNFTTAEQKRQHDSEITKLLESKGWKVIRVWEHEFKADNDVVGKLIDKELGRVSKPSDMKQQLLTEWTDGKAYDRIRRQQR